MDKKSDYIIAIGSSAGGLTPLLSFFDYVPQDLVSYVLLSHLPMDYKSELKEILKKHSSVKIEEVTDGMEVEKNTIYLLPSKSMMEIKEGQFKLSNRIEAALYPNWAVNIFMRSLASERKDKSIAVILSGSGTDGTIGASAIKKAGGLVIVQQPRSCEHESMPMSAIEAGIVDYILLPEEMPAAIQLYITGQMKLDKMNL